MSPAITYVLDLIKLGLKLYRELGGDPIDLEQLWADAGAEIKRIDDQQAKDEAAENKVAGGS